MYSINYITYQTFPAETANSQQTISNIKYLVKNNCNVSLVFPLREEQSSSSLSEINKYYNIDEEFKVTGLSHNLPFGKTKIFNKIAFHISHFIWAKGAVKKTIKESDSNDIYITRSDWVLYFLLKNNKKVIFECHQLSKLRKLILKTCLKNPKAKIIFLNSKLKQYFINNVSEKNSIVLHNAVDLQYFKNTTKKKKEVVFVGNLQRFNKGRNLEFIINGFVKSQLSKKYKLKIIGGPEKAAKELMENVAKFNTKENVVITGRLNRQDAIKNISEAEVGILINNSKNKHSLLYTSPLKYFEYLASELIIIAVNYPSHKELPYSENILFFEENDLNQLIKSFNAVLKKSPVSLKNANISLDQRAKKIIATDFPSHKELPYSENILFFKENNLNSFIDCLNKVSAKPPTKLDKSIISLDYRAKKIIEFINF